MTYRRGLLVLAALLLANAALGPVGFDVLAYPLPPTLLDQLRGLELVTLGLVVPGLVAAHVLDRRGRAEAPLVAIGPCGYAAYMFVQYVVGPSRTTYSGAVLLHLAVFAVATLLLLRSWSLATRTAWPVPPRPRRTRWLVLLSALAGFVLLRYLPLFVGAATGADVPEEFALAPGFFWSIVLLDLGLVVPLTVAAAATVRRGAAHALPATYAVVGWFALVPPSVAAMALVMLATDDAYASAPTAALMSVVAVVTSAVAFAMFRDLLRRQGLAARSAPAGARAPAAPQG